MNELDMIRVTKRVKGLCTNASLTGVFQGGTAYLIMVMNEVIDNLKGKAILPDSSIICKHLSKEATLDEVGCAAAIILALLEVE